MDGQHLLRKLAEAKVKYPVFYTGMFNETKADEFRALGLNLTLLSKPFTAETFWEKVCAPLGPCENGEPMSALKKWLAENNERLPH